MTVTPLTHIACYEHMDDLRREAERDRLDAKSPIPRAVRLSIPRSPAAVHGPWA